MALTFIEQTLRTQVVNAAIEVLAEHGYTRASLFDHGLKKVPPAGVL